MESEELFTETIVEEREALMISTGENTPTWRKARFLKPSSNHKYKLDQKREGADRPFDPPPSTAETTNVPKIRFNKRTTPDAEWGSWVRDLSAAHQSTWKNAGIYEPLRASAYPILEQDKNMIFELALKWCPETNTFAFSWGEATITLEDVMVLGGFSLMGICPLTLLKEDEKSRDMRLGLEKVRKKMVSGKCRLALQSQWMDKLKGTRNKFEHLSFLSYWLSRYVFPRPPSSCRAKVINKDVFPVAIQLARGVKIALGPAVLSMLYKNLTILKRKLIGLIESADSGKPPHLWAPFHLVQFWVWERFPMLRPSDNLSRMSMETRTPKLAKWSKAKSLNVEDLRSVLDFAEDTFVWRPHSTFQDHGGAGGKWVSVDGDNDLDVGDQLFYLCVKISILVGFDGWMEKYLPHRVARQFGFDQDIPLHVDVPLNMDPEIFWTNYSKPIDGSTKLYIPSRSINPGITFGYQLWWRRQPFPLTNILITGQEVKDEDHGLLLPGFPHQIEVIVRDSDSVENVDEDNDDQLTKLGGAKDIDVSGSDLRKQFMPLSLGNKFLERKELLNLSSCRELKVEGETKAGKVRESEDNRVDLIEAINRDNQGNFEHTCNAGSSVGDEQRAMTGSCKGFSFKGRGILDEMEEEQSYMIEEELQNDQVMLDMAERHSDGDERCGLSCDTSSNRTKGVGRFRFDLEGRIIRLERKIAEIKATRL